MASCRKLLMGPRVLNRYSDHRGDWTPEQARAQELALQARKDPGAFGLLYEQNYPRILNYIYRRTLNVTVAEDLTSNTFFKALRALPGFRGRCPFQAWLYRIASNEIKAYWRKNRTRQTRHVFLSEGELDRIHFSASQAKDKDGAVERMRHYAFLHTCVRMLPERYETALALRYFEGLKIEHVAVVLGKKVGTVKSLIHRGLGHLRKIIEQKDATFFRDEHL